MKRSAEIIHIVPTEKEQYLEKYLHPTDKIAQILWKCGIRKQYYYEFGGDILRTYEYSGKNFTKDMAIVAGTEETKDFFIKNRRKDIPENKREITNWWAPLKWKASLLMNDPLPGEEDNILCASCAGHGCALDGTMCEGEKSDFCYSDDDWSESVHM
nr:hypothetical protein [uncultured Blautia sp.]